MESSPTDQTPFLEQANPSMELIRRLPHPLSVETRVSPISSNSDNDSDDHDDLVEFFICATDDEDDGDPIAEHDHGTETAAEHAEDVEANAPTALEAEEADRYAVSTFLQECKRSYQPIETTVEVPLYMQVLLRNHHAQTSLTCPAFLMSLPASSPPLQPSLHEQDEGEEEDLVLFDNIPDEEDALSLEGSEEGPPDGSDKTVIRDGVSNSSLASPTSSTEPLSPQFMQSSPQSSAPALQHLFRPIPLYPCDHSFDQLLRSTTAGQSLQRPQHPQ